MSTSENMALTAEQWSELTDAIDTLDNITCALVNLTSLPDKTHVEALRETLPRTLGKMKIVVNQVDPEAW